MRMRLSSRRGTAASKGGGATWTSARETRPTIKLGSAAGPSRNGLPQDVPLSEQRTQTTGGAAGAPRRPGGHDAVYCRRGRDEDVSQCPEDRLLWTLRHLLQSLSSEPSTQSLWRSHRRSR